MIQIYNEAMKSARLQANLTQKEVAEALKVSQPAIARWERGEGSEPSISRLIELADIYNTTVDKLIGRT